MSVDCLVTKIYRNLFKKSGFFAGFRFITLIKFLFLLFYTNINNFLVYIVEEG